VKETPRSTAHAETFYSVTLTCKSVEEAHLRLLLLHALSQGEFGVRCIDSSDIPDTSNVAVTAQVAAANRNDAAVEQIVGWLSLEPRVSAVAWKMDGAIPEARATGSGFPKHNSWNSRLVSGMVSGRICGGGARTIR
jgi:hypothetical protein